MEPLEFRWLLTVYNPVIDPIADREIDEGQGVDFEVSLRDADLLDTYTATIDWGDGPVEDAVVDVDPRDTSALTVTIDYRFDDNNFFDTQAKKDLLQIAADAVASHFGDTLAAIMPEPDIGNTWEAIPNQPATGEDIILPNLEIAENEILVFVGSREFDNSNLAVGGFGGLDGSGTQEFADAIKGRGEPGALGDDAVIKTDFGRWGGSIAFSASEDIDWHFGLSTEGLGVEETDFLSVAVHEFAHVFGFGTAESWEDQTDEDNNLFQGLASTFEFDELGPVPLEPDDPGHWEEGITEGGVETAMDPKLNQGTRKMLTPLDFAGLTDVGWELLGETTGTIAGSHVYADDGTYTVTVRLTEENTGVVTEQTFEVTVQNVLPEITVADDQLVVLGDVLTITNIVTITDPGFAEEFSVEINWGDGSVSDKDIATIDTAGGPGVLTIASSDASHIYSADDTYIVTVFVNDGSNNFVNDTFMVQVVLSADAVIDMPPAISENEILNLDGQGILANDFGDGLQVTKIAVFPEGGGDPIPLPLGVPVELESGAVVTVFSDGRLEYDPTFAEAFNALDALQMKSDLFTYEITDSSNNTDTATIELVVEGRDDAPVTVEFNTSLVRSLSPTDSFGEVEVLPSDRPWLHEWNDFWLEVWVQVQNQKVTNIESALADVVYNSDYFTATLVVAGSAFASGLTSTIDDTAGTVHLEGESMALKRIGADQPVLLARVRFKPTGVGPGVPILLDEPVPVTPVDGAWIVLAGTDATVTPGTVLAAVDRGPAPTTELYPLMYDLDDDGKISFGDLAYFASFFLADVSKTPEAAKADFFRDDSNRVNFSDFAFLAANFLKNRSSGDSIRFPDNFPEDFGPQALVVDAAGSPPGAAILTDDQLGAIAREAAARLGISADAVTFEVVDLREGVLGQASGGTIQLDADAAGYGWYVDTTPSDDLEFSAQISATEFAAAADSEAHARVDLLTVVMHELGHVLGYAHSTGVHSTGHTSTGELMDGTLTLGTRRLLGDDDDSDGDFFVSLDGFFAALDD